MSAVYVAEARGTPEARDDAKNLDLFTVAALPASLAFDHAQILADYAEFLRSRRVAPLRLRD